ncbi:protein kinase [Candidatus Latescibacterota bacterium]
MGKQYSIDKILEEGEPGTDFLYNVIKTIDVGTMEPDELKDYVHNYALMSSKLNGHPNIVDVYGFHSTHQGGYIVNMEFIDGYSLSDLQNILKKLDTKLPPEFALYIASLSCEGLEYAHTRVNDSDGNLLNIIHRDISPSNIMVTSGGNVKIIDFGIAKGESREQSQSGTGLLKGKLTYMAPEQLKCIDYDFRVDIYSLGIVLLELLTGESLYGGDENLNRLTFIQNATKQNVDIPGLLDRHDINESIRAIIYKAIAVEPQDRYQSAKDMNSDIKSALSNKSETELGYKLAKFMKELTRTSKEPEKKKELYDSLSSTGEGAYLRRNEKRYVIERAIKQGGFGNIFKVKMKLSPESDSVHFSITSPQPLVSGQSYILDVWIYKYIQRVEMLKRAKELQHNKTIQIQEKGPITISRSSKITINLNIPDFQVIDPEETIFWDGNIGNARFPVTVPDDTCSGEYLGVVKFYIEGLMIAKLHFSLIVSQHKSSEDQFVASGIGIKTAFASYASVERERVLARIQGIMKAMPHLDIFLDVRDLISGDSWEECLNEEIKKRDIFYLFWSVAASNSDWVKNEWRTALKLKGIEFIDPVPLDPPEKVSPPKELSQLHFNDWTLAYLRGVGNDK